MTGVPYAAGRERLNDLCLFNPFGRFDPFWHRWDHLNFEAFLMTPSKKQISIFLNLFELDFAKSSHVLLAWLWLRSHRRKSKKMSRFVVLD